MQRRRRRRRRCRPPRAFAADTAPRSCSVTRRSARQQQVRADDADRETDGHLERELADDRPERPVSRSSRTRSCRSSARSRPGRSRPTRPRGSCRSARRPRAARARRTSPRGRWARARRRSGRRTSTRSRAAQCAASVSRPAVANVPTMPSERIGTSAMRGTSPADPRAAVEEDHDERDDADPLDRADRDVAESGKSVREQGGGHEEQRRPGDAEPLAQRLAAMRGRSPRRRGARAPRSRGARSSGRLYGETGSSSLTKPQGRCNRGALHFLNVPLNNSTLAVLIIGRR